MNTSADSDPRTAALQAELDAVKRREAEYRNKIVHEFLDKGERNTYLHILRQERAELIKRDQASSADLEVLTRKVEAAEALAASLQAELREARRPWWERFFKESAPVAPTANLARIPGAAFTYYLHTSPFRIFREGQFTLKGWAWPQDGRAVTGIRVDIDGAQFAGRTGLDEPEVIARYGAQPANPKPGFEVTFETPPGRHSFSLEAQLGDSEWRSVMRTSIWCDPAPK